MEPFISTLTTVIGLVCCYRQEVVNRKNAVTNAKLEHFLEWLDFHKFEELGDLIRNSAQIKGELQGLMEAEFDEIGKKLDTLNGAVAALGMKIDGLSGLAIAMGADRDALSDQAVAILKEFANSDSNKMGLFLNLPEPQCALFPENRSFGVSGPKFLADDINTLESFGFIKLVDHNNSGNPLYALTRQGANFVQQLAEKDKE